MSLNDLLLLLTWTSLFYSCSCLQFFRILCFHSKLWSDITDAFCDYQALAESLQNRASHIILCDYTHVSPVFLLWKLVLTFCSFAHVVDSPAFSSTIESPTCPPWTRTYHVHHPIHHHDLTVRARLPVSSILPELFKVHSSLKRLWNGTICRAPSSQSPTVIISAKPSSLFLMPHTPL